MTLGNMRELGVHRAWRAAGTSDNLACHGSEPRATRARCQTQGGRHRAGHHFKGGTHGSAGTKAQSIKEGLGDCDLYRAHAVRLVETDQLALARRRGPMMFRHACRMGLEGIVAKRWDPPYWSGRCPDSIKVKNPQAPAASCRAEVLVALLRGSEPHAPPCARPAKIDPGL
jgi:hypothetical protein